MASMLTAVRAYFNAPAMVSARLRSYAEPIPVARVTPWVEAPVVEFRRVEQDGPQPKRSAPSLVRARRGGWWLGANVRRVAILAVGVLAYHEHARLHGLAGFAVAFVAGLVCDRLGLLTGRIWRS